MARSDLGIPGRSALRARGGCRWSAALAFIVLLALFVCGIVLLYFGRIPTYTLPKVVIIEPQYGAELISGRAVPVLSSAISADRIVKQELWADEVLVYVASTADPQGKKDFTATMLWTPKAGPHTLLSRAVDARGSVGTSSVVRVTVVDAGAKKEPENALQVAKAGDSLSSVGAENNVTPEAMREANPDLPEQLAPGDWVNVPPGDDQEGRNDDQLGGAVDDPGAESLPGDLPVGPADPNPDLPGFGPPLLFWDTILPWRDPSPRAPAAPKLKVAPGPDCSAVLAWQDNSDNEKGFYIYRLIPGAPRFQRMEREFRANNANRALTYTDQGISGHIEYYVAAFNAAGEAASRPVVVNIGNQNCNRNGNVVPPFLEIEAEKLEVQGTQPEQLYCYAALKGTRPFQRIPDEQSQYLNRRQAGGWNIDEYYAGRHKQVGPAPEAGQSFRVEVECWGARVTNEGGESFSLGQFDQSHPPAEWDGRALTGRGRSFTLIYHIRPWSGPEGGWQEVDTDWSMPRPYDFRQVVGIDQCITHTPGDEAGARFACALMDYPSQFAKMWEFDGDPAQIDGFRILENRSATGGTWAPTLDIIQKDKRMWFAQLPYQRACGETRRYKVVAFRGVDTSLPSNEVQVSGDDCDRILAIVTLDDLLTRDFDDGCNYVFLFGCRDDKTMEAYGIVRMWTVDGSTGEPSGYQSLSLGWGGLGEIGTLTGGVSGSPEYLRPVKINSDDDIAWEDLPLCHVGTDGRWQVCEDIPKPDTNNMSFVVKYGDRLQGEVQLWDYDTMSGDDLWCEAQFEVQAPVSDFHPSEETPGNAAGGSSYGHCAVGLTVRWEHIFGSRVVRPLENPPSPSYPTHADLRVINVSRNSLGNLRVTLFNHGPDTLIQELVTLQFQVTLFPTDEGAQPPPPTGDRERFLVTVPAYGQTTLDTGLVLNVNYRKQVRVTSSTTGNLIDPDETNNSRCWEFMPGTGSSPLPNGGACR